MNAPSFLYRALLASVAAHAVLISIAAIDRIRETDQPVSQGLKAVLKSQPSLPTEFPGKTSSKAAVPPIVPTQAYRENVSRREAPPVLARDLPAEESVRAPSVVQAPSVTSLPVAQERSETVTRSGSLEVAERNAVQRNEARPEAVDADGLRQYRVALAREARRYRQYPAVARVRAWEGTVEIKVNLRSGGAPVLGLGRSSGHDVLDQQALEMMGRAILTAMLPESLRGSNLSIPVPVRFSLDD